MVCCGFATHVGACPATVTNPGFVGDLFPNGVAPGWSVSQDSGVTWFRTTGASFEGGVAQGVRARNGWSQKAHIFQTIGVCPGTEYEIRITGSWYRVGGDSTRWTSQLGVAQGPTNQWSNVVTAAQLWPGGVTTVENSTVALRVVSLDNQLTVMVRIDFAWSDAYLDNLEVIEIGPATIPPTPTRTNTPTPPNTHTPTPTVPADLGPNLLVNGDFEADFVDGVAQGWTAQANTATGYTKENAKLGRIGGSIYGWRANAGDQLGNNIYMMGKSYVVDLSTWGATKDLREALGDDVLIVAKHDPDADFPGFAWENPEVNGRQFADNWYQRSVNTNIWAHAYAGLNEAHMNIEADLAKVARFELAFTRRLHELGLRSVVLNHSFGTPGDLNLMLIPEMVELFQEADYVGYHAYSDPSLRLMCDSRGFDIVFRYDLIEAMYAERGWRVPPLIWKEAGSHDIVPGGFPSPTDVRDDLICIEAMMRDRPSLIGMNYFLTAGWAGQWEDFDITQYPVILDAVHQLNQTYPVDARRGTNAQQVGGERESFDRAVTQRVDTHPGSLYLVNGWVQYTFYDGYPNAWPSSAEVHIGWDPTGQTSDIDAPTIEWSPNLVGETLLRETDMWFQRQEAFLAVGDEASLWLRGKQDAPIPAVRVGFDDFQVQQILGEGEGPGVSHILLR